MSRWILTFSACYTDIEVHGQEADADTLRPGTEVDYSEGSITADHIFFESGASLFLIESTSNFPSAILLLLPARRDMILLLMSSCAKSFQFLSLHFDHGQRKMKVGLEWNAHLGGRIELDQSGRLRTTQATCRLLRKLVNGSNALVRGLIFALSTVSHLSSRFYLS